jgi:hypothetical protein
MVSHYAGFSTEHNWRLTIEGRFDGVTAALEDMGVDHGGLHVFVTEQLLNCANIVVVLQKVGSKGMTKRVRSDMLVNFRKPRGLFDGLSR